MLVLGIAYVTILLSLGALVYCGWWMFCQVRNVLNDSIMEYRYRKAKGEITTYFETLRDVIDDYEKIHWA